MGCRESIFLFLTIAILHLLFHMTLPAVSAPAAAARVTLIQNTCKKTKYYDLCVASLKSDPTSQAADAKGLAAIMIGVAISNANATSSFLSSLVTSTTANDPTTAKLLKDCADKYTLSAISLQDSVQDLSMESYDYAYMNVLAAQDYPNACHNAFKRSLGRVAYPTELSRREDSLRRMCDVAISIIDVLASSQ